jgi:hypothetical protein
MPKVVVDRGRDRNSRRSQHPYLHGVLRCSVVVPADVSWVTEGAEHGRDLAQLDRLTTLLADTLGCGSTLFVPCDVPAAWSWLGYGLPEAACAVTVNPPAGPRKIGTVGVALPGLRVAVMAATAT